MTFEPYRRLLAGPGVRTLLLVGLLARIPVTAIGLTLTLYVVGELDLGFLQAGLVGAATTGGIAIGSPVTGRLVDRYGLRPVVAVTTAAQTAFWSTAAFLPYWPLVAGAFTAGVLALPVFTVVRQCLAAMVPPERRRTAFALDSVLVEVSYMVGPAAAVAVATTLGGGWSMALVGVGLVGSGAALIVLNPPTVDEDEPSAQRASTSGTDGTDSAAVPGGADGGTGPAPRRRWLTPALLSLLGVTFAATFVLTATELGVVAVLKADGAAEWTGLVIGLWCLASLVGGVVYGALPRGFSPLVMTGGMAALTIPVGLVSGWPLLCLALVPCGLLCAPAMSSVVDAISRWVPAGSRGAAMGLHGSALTLGLTFGSPVTGMVIDRLGTAWAFTVAGLGGVALVALALPFRQRRDLTPANPAPTAAATAAADPPPPAKGLVSPATD